MLRRSKILSICLAIVLSTSALFAQKYTFKIEEVLPHDRNAYTQGLFFHEGQLYESCGGYGTSSFRLVDLKSGNVLKKIEFDRSFFIEGSCVMGNLLYILTWQEKVCLVYDIRTLKKIGYFRMLEEGWGLTSDGEYLIASDGSAKIYFRDPETFVVKKSIEVSKNGYEVKFLNELEYINGEIWANVYGWDEIVVIDPATGKVTKSIDCTSLLDKSLIRNNTDVLNGIAYDAKSGNIYLTGKNWPKMYRISIVQQ